MSPDTGISLGQMTGGERKQDEIEDRMIDESERDRERKGRARREKKREILCMWERE